MGANSLLNVMARDIRAQAAIHAPMTVDPLALRHQVVSLIELSGGRDGHIHSPSRVTHSCAADGAILHKISGVGKHQFWREQVEKHTNWIDLTEPWHFILGCIVTVLGITVFRMGWLALGTVESSGTQKASTQIATHMLGHHSVR